MNTLKNLIDQAWRQVKKDGSFANNFAVILSGTGLNILIQIFIAPILTRLYGPVAYGLYSLFNALCTNLALLSTLRLPQALLLPKDDAGFNNLARLSILSSLLFSVVIFVVLFFAGEPVLRFLNAEKLYTYYYLIPVMIFSIALNQVIGNWQYRLNVFKRSVAIDTSVLIGVRVFNLGFGFLTNGMIMGLVLGDMLGKFSGLILGWKFVIKEKIRALFGPLQWHQIRNTLYEYRHYPLHNLPGVWSTMIADQLPIYMISAAYGPGALGLVSLATSMLDIPKRLFAYSIASLFYKKAVDLKEQSLEELQRFVVKVMYFLLAIGLVPYSVVIAFGPEIFSFVFGSMWKQSGELARYLSAYFILELIYISVDSIYYVLREVKKMFFFQVFALAGRFAVLFLTIRYFSLTLEESIAYMAAFNGLLYTAQFSYVLHLLRLSWLKHASIILSISGIVIALMFGFRELLCELFS